MRFTDSGFGRVAVCCAGLFLAAFSLCAAPKLTLKVDATKPAHTISPNLYGVFFEDINYAADGGLYGELIQNRSFEFAGQDALFGWSQVERGGAFGSLSIESERPLKKKNPHYLRLAVKNPGAGIGVANAGFGGINIQNGSNYLFSIYGRALSGGSLSIELISAKGKVIGGATVVGLNPGWDKYTSVIRATGTESNATLVVMARTAGTIDVDMVSLFPEHTFKNRPNGLRADLAQAVADLKPSFVRFPGGCIVEGKDLLNAYRWKDTIGDVSERPINWNRWQNAMPNAQAPQYYQSYGLGFYEYFQFCEDIGAEPLPILNCGMSCQFQDKQLVPMDDLNVYIQDALDLIEFANGSEETPWGAKRAEMGHPEPFHMTYLGIGNEQWGEDYIQRYQKFSEALKEQHPEIKLVASAGPDPSGDKFDLAWTNLSSLKADLVDEHYYRPPSWFFANAGRYDKYDRNGPSVFAGEYAAHTESRKNNLEAALAEAAFMTGLERNSDLVEMASYAPLLAKKGFSQWDVDLIWFDNTRVYGTPSYYVQKLFSCNRGDILLPAMLTDERKANKKSQFFAVASRNVKDGQIIIKAVNPSDESVTVKILLSELPTVKAKGEVITLSGEKLADENSFKEPNKIAPVTKELTGVSENFNYSFKPYSVTVLKLNSGLYPMANLIAALAGFLAFQGELMAGKILLPRFGGASYVWCSTVLFFQIVLLAGYFGSRWLSETSINRRRLSLGLLGASGFLTLLRPEFRLVWLPEELQPFLGLIPFAGLSAVLFCTTPLLHRYQAEKSNYGLYAWSNGGALAGLACYPLLVEPHSDLTAQNWVWSVAGMGICAFLMTRGRAEPNKSFGGSGNVRWQWWVLPAISSSLLLASTSQLSYEASAGPLTWALPLVLFLASYVWAFGADRRNTVAIVAIVGLIALTIMVLAGPRTPQKLGLLLLGAGTAMAVCHTCLASSRNENSHSFYAITALSGTVGSLITIFIFPRISTSPIEFHILAVGVLVIGGFVASSRLLRPLMAIIGVIAVGITLFVVTGKNENEVVRCRNLYGCSRVLKKVDVDAFTLINNNTAHGEENRGNPERGLSYYTPESGVAKAILNAREANTKLTIGVIGLGTGTINYWARPEDSVVYYEINPQVEMLARGYFSYLTDATRVQLGDGRKCLESEPNTQAFDVMILDAFTGDGIPAHLLTDEAGKIYRSHLKPNGRLVVHITNSHVDLLPVVKGLALSMGMGVESAETDRVHWVILSDGAPIPVGNEVIRWTDERNSIVQVIK